MPLFLVKYKNSTNKKRNKTLEINPAENNSEEKVKVVS